MPQPINDKAFVLSQINLWYQRQLPKMGISHADTSPEREFSHGGSDSIRRISIKDKNALATARSLSAHALKELLSALHEVGTA
jgi:hypothetical protein